MSKRIFIKTSFLILCVFCFTPAIYLSIDLENRSISFIPNLSYPQPDEYKYLKKKEIRGIVEGDALIFDHKVFFAQQDLESCSAIVDVVCNNKTNLEISIGYKSSAFELLEIPKNDSGLIPDNQYKEVVLWSTENLFPASSVDLTNDTYMQNTTQLRSIHNSWNITAIGFSKEDYVNAEERIWFLRVSSKESTNGSLNLTDTNDTRINYLKSFQLHYDNLIFESLFHPFFDSSCEIVIPIRGVHHEIKRSSDEEQTVSKATTKEYYETPGYDFPGSNRWAVVFATSMYDKSSLEDCPDQALAASALILGISNKYIGSISVPVEWQYYGLVDYGWHVIYCIDYSGLYTPLSTVAETKKEYFMDMMDEVNTNVGSGDELFVYVFGHGRDGSEHKTYTTIARPIFPNRFIKLDDYKTTVSDITDDGTYVFLWVKACYGYGFDDWDQSEHNNRLMICYYQEISAVKLESAASYDSFAWPMPARGYFDTRLCDINWCDYQELLYRSNLGDDISEMKDDIKKAYDNWYYLRTGANDSEIFFSKYWGSYQFSLRNSGMDINHFEYAWLVTSSDYIDSTKTADEIEFSYTGGGSGYEFEAYQITFPDCSDDFMVRIVVDWEVGSNMQDIWHTLLELGQYIHHQADYTRIYALGTRDAWSGNYGYFRSYVSGIWHNTYNYGEVGYLRENVELKIIRIGTTLTFLIKDNGSYLYIREITTSTYSINCIRFYYQHHATYYTGISSWRIWYISTDIEY
ncbi:MAG: hypothetical protein HZR80_15165 [Candidatus Heimdallarchaeota archaeon]